MYGRYRRTTSEEELARLYHIPIPPQRDLPISWNIAPSQDVLVIRYNPKAKQRSLDALRWGLIPYWTTDPAGPWVSMTGELNASVSFARAATCHFEPV
jgi:putative SOS response-associated peptidase YedK